MYHFWVVSYGQESNREYEFLSEEQFWVSEFSNARSSRIAVRDEAAALEWQRAYDDLQEALWTPNQDSRDGSLQEYARQASLAREVMRRLEAEVGVDSAFA